MRTPRVAISWSGLPRYAEAQVRAALRMPGAVLDVIALRGPKAGLDGDLGFPVHWITAGENVSWTRLGLGVPDVFFCAGWSAREFWVLAHAVKRQGGRVVCMVDNNLKHSLRQKIGRYWFRMQVLPHIDAVLVPGNGARELMDYFGVPDKAVYTGLYAADGEVFAAGPPLASRGRDFVFVGQFIERKGVRDLIRAVERLRAEGYACELLAIGEGGLLNALSKAGVATLGFSAPETIAQELQRSRFLVLPSLEDHWGVVVHEATLSGCGLVLATGVGSRHDLLSIENGFLSVSGNADSLYAAMKAALGVDESWMDRCWRVSTDLAAEFSPRKWAATVWGIVASLEAVGAAPEPPTTPSPRTSERGDRGTNHEGVRSLSEDATR